MGVCIDGVLGNFEVYIEGMEETYGTRKKWLGTQ